MHVQRAGESAANASKIDVGSDKAAVLLRMSSTARSLPEKMGDAH
jgi:hypothetical protein